MDIRAAKTALMIAASIALGSCAQHAQSAKGPQIDAVSKGVPTFARLASAGPMLRRATPVPSRGSCAPNYKNGLHGTRIADKPCRGFGVIGKDGKPCCTCYAVTGGCKPGFRCDPILKRCVRDDASGYGRFPSD